MLLNVAVCVEFSTYYKGSLSSDLIVCFALIHYEYIGLDIDQIYTIYI